MEDDSHRELYRQVFGDSSESDCGIEIEQDDELLDVRLAIPEQNIPTWERIEEIKGLWLSKDFLSPQKQSLLLSAIENEGWFTEGTHNQAMRFGILPTWVTKLSDSICESVLLSDEYSEQMESNNVDWDMEYGIFPSNLLWRKPLFDQLIVNVYHPGEGICAHVDLLRFEDGIAIISLESSCVMHFTEVGATDHGITKEEQSESPTRKIPVLLSPGSLVLMSGEARYHWKHEINRKPGFQMWKGQELVQMKRTSITLRKLALSD